MSCCNAIGWTWRGATPADCSGWSTPCWSSRGSKPVGPIVSPVTVDLGALTAQIASSFAGLCERAGIDLVLACEPVVADVDVAMWETIVLNLMSNAVKFTFSGSITVTVAAGADPTTARYR